MPFEQARPRQFGLITRLAGVHSVYIVVLMVSLLSVMNNDLTSE